MSKDKTQTESVAQKRQYIHAPAVVDPGVPCVHCGALYGHRIVCTYGNGNRRRICAKCGKPFVTIRKRETLGAGAIVACLAWVAWHVASAVMG